MCKNIYKWWLDKIFLKLVNHQITPVCLNNLNLQYYLIWSIIIEGIWSTPFLCDCLSKNNPLFYHYHLRLLLFMKRMYFNLFAQVIILVIWITYYRLTEVNLLSIILCYTMKIRFTYTKHGPNGIWSLTFYYFLPFFTYKLR